jgi:hypothetical protein
MANKISLALALFVIFVVGVFVDKCAANADEILTPFEITATVTLPSGQTKTFEYTPTGTRQLFKSQDECMKFIGSDEFAPMLKSLADVNPHTAIRVNCVAVPVPGDSI